MKILTDVLLKILENTSLWEVMAFLALLYLLFRPDIWKRITRLKVGEFEVELKALKDEVKKGSEKIVELESELEVERRRFDELLDSFDANAPLEELAKVRQAIKSQANNTSEIEVFRKYLKIGASSEELFTAAVSIREKRPVVLLPDLINLLDELAHHKKLGGFRLNIIWTLTSAVHRILITAIRDGVPPFPSAELMDKAEAALAVLDTHPRVVNDRPDDPMRGIKGPIKHSLKWIEKGRQA